VKAFIDSSLYVILQRFGSKFTAVIRFLSLRVSFYCFLSPEHTLNSSIAFPYDFLKRFQSVCCGF